MKNGFALFWLLMVTSSDLFAQSEKRIFSAARIDIPPHMDGIINDSCWLSIPAATSFTQFEPYPGTPSTQNTEVRIAYDNTAFYVGAIMSESSKDSVTAILTKRDDAAEYADFIAVGFDTYRDGQNAFVFLVTAAGVQSDMKFTSSGEDASWDAVWESKTVIGENGWSVELKIPFSALRFSKAQKQSWGMNILRHIRRVREFSSWNPVDPKNEGTVNQFGILENISDVVPPLRLSIYPYLSVYLKNYGGVNTRSFNAGADIKYGLSEAFTLDATLIPDFGQVRSDDVILNLSPFETYYEEQRQFFTEGTEMFGKADIFYSRRIAGTPMLFYDVYDMVKPGEIIKENPTAPQLINATKISGRTQNKTGLGFLNATTAPTYATALDTSADFTREIMTQPLTNYNLLVLDQALRYNSYIAFINSNVLRSGTSSDANVTGTEFRIMDEANAYSVDGTAVISRQYQSGSSEAGHYYSLNLSKIKGNFTAETEYSVMDDRYDPNDLGYLYNNNETSVQTYMKYSTYNPFWKILRTNTAFSANYNRLYNPSVFTGLYLHINNFTTFSNYLSSGFWFNFSPVYSYDFYEPRVPGKYYRSKGWFSFSGFFSSDYSKPFALDGNLGYGQFYQFRNNRYYSWSVRPLARIGSKLRFSYDFSYSATRNDAGFAGLSGDSVFFGRRDILTSTNSFYGSYIFSRNMSASLRARHYWSSAGYAEYFNLNDDGTLTAAPYGKNSDINFTAFNIDFSFTWQFAPGSECSVVWKNSISEESDIIPGSFTSNIENTFALPQSNSISLKILYFIDYNTVFRKRN